MVLIVCMSNVAYYTVVVSSHWTLLSLFDVNDRMFEPADDIWLIQTKEQSQRDWQNGESANICCLLTNVCLTTLTLSGEGTFISLPNQVLPEFIFCAINRSAPTAKDYMLQVGV